MDSSFHPSPYLLTLLERLAAVPPTEKQFTADSEWAAEHLSMTDDVFTELVRHGLPALTTDDRIFADSRDLTSASYTYSPASANRRSAQLWTRQLRNLHVAPAGHDITFAVRCPTPGHTGGCDWQYLEPESPACRVTTGDDGALQLSAGFSGPPVTAPPQVAALLDRYADVSFHLLPEQQMQPGLIRSRRLAECDTMARTVLEDALREGVEARPAFGLIVARPYSSTHSWVEFRIGDAWIPYDAFLLRSMRGWDIPKAQSLDPLMSLNGFLLRLTGDRRPLVTHRGDPVQPALPTRRVPLPTI